jgi:hypothetical protein
MESGERSTLPAVEVELPRVVEWLEERKYTMR